MNIIDYQPGEHGLMNLYRNYNRWHNAFFYAQLERFLLGRTRTRPELSNAQYNRLWQQFLREHPKLGVRYTRNLRPLRFKQPLPSTPKRNTVGTLFERAYLAATHGGQHPLNATMHRKFLAAQKERINATQRQNENRKHEAARRIQSVWRKSKRAVNMRNMNQIKALLNKANRLAIGTYQGTKFNQYKNLRRNLSNYTLSNNVQRALKEYRRTGTVKFYSSS